MRVRQLTHYIITCILLGNLALSHAEELPKGCGTIVYSANPQYPPYHWTSNNSSFQGASLDLLKLVIPAAVKLKPVVYPWKRALFMAEHGEIDLLLSLRKTPERSELLSFTTQQAFPNPIVVFVRKNKSFPFNKWSDLKGYKGVISLGDKFGNGFDEYWKKELAIQETGTMKENFQRLENGLIDYFITGEFTGKAFLHKNSLRHEIINLSPPISEEGIYFGFSKKSPCAPLVNQIDRKLAELEKQGTPRKLLNKYLQPM
jgi:polar amino acid transport system substrate-binding protein